MVDIQPCHVSLASSLKQKNCVNPSLTTLRTLQLGGHRCSAKERTLINRSVLENIPASSGLHWLSPQRKQLDKCLDPSQKPVRARNHYKQDTGCKCCVCLQILRHIWPQCFYAGPRVVYQFHWLPHNKRATQKFIACNLQCLDGREIQIPDSHLGSQSLIWAALPSHPTTP